MTYSAQAVLLADNSNILTLAIYSEVSSHADSLEDSHTLAIGDYLTGTEEEVKTGKTAKMELCDSNVLGYVLEDGSTVLVRPSGTEPKIKIYILAKGKDAADQINILGEQWKDIELEMI